MPARTPFFAGTKAGEVLRLKFGKIEIPMSWCPPGQFMMGSPLTEVGRSDDEGPVAVTITKGFWAMQTQVTQALYEAVMGNNPSGIKGPTLPVEHICLYDAIDCGEELTQTLQDSGALPSDWTICLPTEAQWEYAARAGTKSATPFGNSLSSTQANFDGNHPYGGAATGPYLERTTEVGSYKHPNAWGLLDTVGNVCEWTWDDYESKLPGGSDPFMVKEKASVGVYRGGGWFRLGQYCRSASRGRGDPGGWDVDLGFRLFAVQSLS